MSAGSQTFATLSRAEHAMAHHHTRQQQTSTSSLNAAARSSSYASDDLPPESRASVALGPSFGRQNAPGHPSADGTMVDRRELTDATNKTSRASANGTTARRRISRACDQCNQLRTKCDGKSPCAHCVELGLTCEYVREWKKRGKASRKDIAAQKMASSQNGGHDGEYPGGEYRAESLPDDMIYEPEQERSRGSKRKRPGAEAAKTTETCIPPPGLPIAAISEQASATTIDDYDSRRSIPRQSASAMDYNPLHSGVPPISNPALYGGLTTSSGERLFSALPAGNRQPVFAGPSFSISGSTDSPGNADQSAPDGSPGWLSLPPHSDSMYQLTQHMPTSQTLRYPVLRPLLPHIAAIIPTGLACDLLELYFTSTSSAFLQPQSPYVLAYAFRKRSFLRQHNPRVCSPAMLASMLWIAAQTSESAFLTSSPSARSRVCQNLLEVTIDLLKPMIHTSSDSTLARGGNAMVRGVALGGLGVTLPSQEYGMEGGSAEAAGTLDDVVTYMSLATVVSASEYKAASIRWWNGAWSLARELKLGRELPANPGPSRTEGPEHGLDVTGETANGPSANYETLNGSGPRPYSDEEREERRRIWWLLYIVDRHLALCYNRPLFLLDVECDELFQPDDDNIWQAGEVYHAENTYFRQRGPNYECTGHTLYGFFLPLMSILGGIVDLNHAKNHPRFGKQVRSDDYWDDQVAAISQQLETYERSLAEFQARHGANLTSGEPPQAEDLLTPPAHAGRPGNPTPLTEVAFQTKMVFAYGTHLMHTLRILLNCRWDPISLLDDTDLWVSTQTFVSATGHAVSAAEAIDDILQSDPDLSFTPFFFGIYLLQGSFILLMIADKLQGEASESVVKACETIVRAHEACVVTLNNEYQRNFRKVMRSALSQVRGRLLDNVGEQQLRRREVLALYRWTGDGTGLAL